VQGPRASNGWLWLAAVLFALTGAAPTEADAPAAAGGARATVTEGFLEGAEGVRLFYRRVGTLDKPVAVFVHGGPGLHMGDGGYDMEPLADRWNLILYDQRGAGRSEIVTDPKRLTAADHVRDLEAVRRHFGLERMRLIGLSWGAGLATLYATEHPERVERLLLVSPMPPARTPFMQERTHAIERLVGSAGASRSNEIRKLLPGASDPEALALCLEWFGISSRPYLLRPEAFTSERSKRMCDAPPASLRNRFVVVSAVVESLGDWDFRPGLARLRMPALVVEGERTNVPLDATRAWAAALPEARLLLVPDAGHVHFIERPEAFFPAAEQFLAGTFPKEAVRVPR
jgi:proline iminopeptidase